MSVALAQLVLALALATAPAPDAWCPSRDAPAALVAQVDAALRLYGHNPCAVYPPSRDWPEGSITTRSAMLWMAWYESRFDQHAFAEGNVYGCHNRARGIWQIGDCPRWYRGAPPTDAQAFSAAWSALWIAQRVAQLPSLYPNASWPALDPTD